MDKTLKATLFIIAISLIGINIQLFIDKEINLINEAKAEVAGMSAYDLRTDYDFKKAVRRVVERYCTVDTYYEYGNSVDC